MVLQQGSNKPKRGEKCESGRVCDQTASVLLVFKETEWASKGILSHHSLTYIIPYHTCIFKIQCCVS